MIWKDTLSVHCGFRQHPAESFLQSQTPLPDHTEERTVLGLRQGCTTEDT